MDAALHEANQRALDLHARGQLREAVAAFDDAIARFPQTAALHHNRAQTLDELGETAKAIDAYDRAIACDPSLTPARVAKAGLLLRNGQLEASRAAYEAALATDPNALGAHLGLYELLQVLGERDAALAHQRAALSQQRLYSHNAPRQARSVLVLCAAGDLQTNVPVDFLFDRTTTTFHKLFLLHVDQHDELPPYDVVFNAIAESDAAVEPLAWAQAFVHAQHRPALNASERVLATARAALSETLANVDATVAPIARCARAQLLDGYAPFAFPLIARPVGSHAGHGLARIETSAALRDYAAPSTAQEFFVSPFIDYKSVDGFYRKYRIIYVDGEPYPVHLAISPRWMIHYYNAAMAENAWMRDEEAAFMADFTSVFSGRLQRAVRAVGTAVGLDYFGIDCAIDRDGRLLVFEADAAMLVHANDPPDLYPYKRAFVPRIFRAVERMIDRRKGADT